MRRFMTRSSETQPTQRSTRVIYRNELSAIPTQVMQNKPSNLKVTHPTDTCEREADHMANRVLQNANCFCDGGCPGCREEQTKLASRFSEASGVVSSSGQLLSPNIRESMEHGFCQDFSQVRIHADAKTEKTAQSLNARAFTTGDHIGFAQGEYNPHSQSGKKLLAHELSHVVQQQKSGGQQGVVFRQDAGLPAAPALSHDDQVWQLIEDYRDRGGTAYGAWDLAREDYRVDDTAGGNAVLRDAEHYLFRYMLASNLDDYVWINDGLPINIWSWINPGLIMNAEFMQEVHDPIYNNYIRPVLEEIIDIAPTTPSMTEWEQRGWDDGYCAAGNCNYREEDTAAEDERRERLNDYYSDPYVIMGIGGP